MSANPFDQAMAATATSPFDKKTKAANPFDTAHQQKDKVQGVLQNSLDYASKPLSAVDAILGAPERFVQGSASHGNPFNGVYSAFHPSDTKTTQGDLQKIEDALHLPKVGGVGKVAEDTLLQMAMDPLSYAGGLGIAGKGGKLAKLGDAIAKMPAVQRNAITDFFRLRPTEELKDFKPQEIAMLKNLSDVWRAALFVNPIPHGFNISRLAYYGGGMPAVGRGLKNFARGVPEELSERMESSGIHVPQYISGPKTPFEEKLGDVAKPIGWLRDKGQAGLSRMEKAMRGGLTETLEKGKKPRLKLDGGGEPKRMVPPEVVADVNKAMGQMGDVSSKAIKWATAHGAPFAPWRLGVVPQALTKGVLEHPERVERYARLGTTANQDTKQNIELSGPEEDFAKLANVPMGTAKYAITTGGPAAQTLSKAGNAKQMEQALWASLMGLVPGGSFLEAIPQLDPYKEKGDILKNLLLRLIGGYEAPPPK